MATSLKLPEEVKEELNNYRYDKEAYHVVIRRLIEENKQLKEDKKLLTNILNNSVTAKNDVKIYTEIIYYILNGSSTNEVKLQELENYFSDKIESESVEVLEAIENVKFYYPEEYPNVLDDFETIVRN